MFIALDRFAQVWQLGCAQAAFTLEGHEKGVNCIDYYTGGDKPYLISGADDRMVRVWDYQVRCVSPLHICARHDDNLLLRTVVRTSVNHSIIDPERGVRADL